MKKYLREIEIAGLILTAIGVGVSWTMGYQYGVFPCGCGLLLLLMIFLYKAFHWKSALYRRENTTGLRDSGLGQTAADALGVLQVTFPVSHRPSASQKAKEGH